jgi:hypothetical protein
MPHKSLNELSKIAFDAFQTFAATDKKYSKKWDKLTAEEQLVWERVASRVEAETMLRALQVWVGVIFALIGMYCWGSVAYITTYLVLHKLELRW